MLVRLEEGFQEERTNDVDRPTHMRRRSPIQSRGSTRPQGRRPDRPQPSVIGSASRNRGSKPPRTCTGPSPRVTSPMLKYKTIPTFSPRSAVRSAGVASAARSFAAYGAPAISWSRVQITGVTASAYALGLERRGIRAPAPAHHDSALMWSSTCTLRGLEGNADRRVGRRCGPTESIPSSASTSTGNRGATRARPLQ